MVCKDYFSEAFFFTPKNRKGAGFCYAMHSQNSTPNHVGRAAIPRLVIYYKFVGYLEIPANLSAPNYRADLRQGVAVEYVSCEPSITARELFGEDAASVEEK